LEKITRGAIDLIGRVVGLTEFEVGNRERPVGKLRDFGVKVVD
jgi:hypothetical protein